MNRSMISQLGQQLAELERELIALKRTPQYDRGVRDCIDLIRYIAQGHPVFYNAVIDRQLIERIENCLLPPKAKP